MNQQKTNMEREKFCFLQTMLDINQKLTSPVSTSKLEAEIKPSCECEKFKYFPTATSANQWRDSIQISMLAKLARLTQWETVK